jgi:TolB-like protein
MLIALCFLLIFLVGCSGNTKFYIRQKVDFNNIKTIAVLPFENFTSDDYAGEKVRSIVITELLSRGKDIVEPGEVTHLLKEMKLKSLKLLTVQDMQNIGETLGAEAVMMGAVESFGISKGISVNYPEVTVNIRLIEISSGEIIWSVRHTSGGPGFWMRHFGSEGPSLSETARKVVKEAIGTLF